MRRVTRRGKTIVSKASWATSNIRTLVAMAWVAAGFLYQLGVTFQWAEVQLLAKLGGWVPHKDRRSGKITLMRGLRRLPYMLATQAIRSSAAAQ